MLAVMPKQHYCVLHRVYLCTVSSLYCGWWEDKRANIKAMITIGMLPGIIPHHKMRTLFISIRRDKCVKKDISCNHTMRQHRLGNRQVGVWTPWGHHHRTTRPLLEVIGGSDFWWRDERLADGGGWRVTPLLVFLTHLLLCFIYQCCTFVTLTPVFKGAVTIYYGK